MEGKNVFIIEINAIKVTNFYKVMLKFKKKRDFGLIEALLIIRDIREETSYEKSSPKERINKKAKKKPKG